MSAECVHDWSMGSTAAPLSGLWVSGAAPLAAGPSMRAMLDRARHIWHTCARSVVRVCAAQRRQQARATDRRAAWRAGVGGTAAVQPVRPALRPSSVRLSAHVAHAPPLCDAHCWCHVVHAVSAVGGARCWRRPLRCDATRCAIVAARCPPRRRSQWWDPVGFSHTDTHTTADTHPSSCTVALHCTALVHPLALRCAALPEAATESAKRWHTQRFFGARCTRSSAASSISAGLKRMEQ